MADSRRSDGVLVVAAIIERKGKILIGQRRAGDWNEFKWEFPGGKVDLHESPRDALARELREELDIQAEIGEEITRYGYQYPGRSPIELIFFRVANFEGEPRNLAFHEIRWEETRKFVEYEFLDGDVDFVKRIVRGELQSNGS